MRKKLLALALAFTLSFLAVSTIAAGEIVRVDGDTQLNAEHAELHGEYIEIEWVNYPPNIGRWRPANRPTGEYHGDSYALWNINVTVPGTYTVYIYFAKHTNSYPVNLEVALGDRNNVLTSTEIEGVADNWTDHAHANLGTIELAEGANTLILAVDPESVSSWVANVKYVRLALVLEPVQYAPINVPEATGATPAPANQPENDDGESGGLSTVVIIAIIAGGVVAVAIIAVLVLKKK